MWLSFDVLWEIFYIFFLGGALFLGQLAKIVPDIYDNTFSKIDQTS